ncbi:hypothetical protein VTH82DRAFT_1846 [Thermothelomyces myriococcoides]
MLSSSMIGYQVEDYSLTLLRHKSYFNNRSLARCLDEEPDEETRTKVRLIKSTKSGGNECVAGRKRDDPDERAGGVNGNKTIFASQRDHLLSKQRDYRKDPVRSRSIEPSGQNLLETSYFWSHVRAELRVDEEEIYGTKPKKTRGQDYKSRPEDEHEGRTLNQSSAPDVSPAASQQSKPETEYPCLPPPTWPPPPRPMDAATNMEVTFLTVLFLFSVSCPSSKPAPTPSQTNRPSPPSCEPLQEPTWSPASPLQNICLHFFLILYHLQDHRNRQQRLWEEHTQQQADCSNIY